ncbi:glycoside hydrolase N-terminal domain-containing protein [Streptomyces sp. NPDC047043]|uniref:glycoside hydrolase N-terminal domain-containing protein n=1 Tax=Streptomyces sp. NPDC047043 TaxID=3154497 RepID=UPI0033ECF6B2
MRPGGGGSPPRRFIAPLCHDHAPPIGHRSPLDGQRHRPQTVPHRSRTDRGSRGPARRRALGHGGGGRPPQITLPERGIHDTSPASSWTDGFLTGNGEYGAVLHGAPALEKVVFNYQRLVLPNGTRDVTPR